MKKRIQNIFKNFEKDLDFVIIKNSVEPFIDENFFYVTDLKTGIFEGASAILYPSGNVELLVSALEAETAKKCGSQINVYKDEKDFYKILKTKISSSKNIGLNFRGLTVKNFLRLETHFPKATFFDVTNALDKTRLIKDENEIKQIKKACSIVDKVVEKIPEILYEGIFEYELAAEINYLIQKNGAEKPSFETISSFGKNTAEPHYSHGVVKLNKGDIVLCDFGACYKRYNSDITRCFIFGKANSKQKKMFEAVLLAQKIGFENARSGSIAKKVHNLVEESINKTQFKGRFVHSTGHSLGQSVHDGGARISSNSELILKENMVFTIEPGIYIPGFGGVRIEDNILIKKGGIEMLTKSYRNLIEIR